MFKNLKWLIFFVLVSLFQISNSSEEPFKVAIIGSGIGGASLSHFLAQKIVNIEIKLFEKEDEAGGRTDQYKMSDEVIVEMGASFFIEANKNLIELAKIHHCDYGSSINLQETMAFGNGKTILFETSSNKYVTLAKMLWSYGLSPFYFFKANSRMIENFLKIYENVTYHNYSEFLSIIKAEEYINITLYEYLQRENYNSDFIQEFVAGVISGIYNQDYKSINALAGMIALAGANNKAFSFKGGNRECIKQIIKNNKKVKFFNGSLAKKITKNNERYSLNYQNKDGENQTEENFDIIVLASPITDIEFQLNFSVPKKNVSYVDAFIYLIAGKLNCTNFDKKLKDDECPGIFMNVDLNNSFISDYSRKCKKCSEIKNEKQDIYKIQTTKKLVEADLKIIFLDGVFKILDEKNWKAYPFLKTLEEKDFYEIKIDEGLYFLNGMEDFASCMEMETISAKNIANLIYEKKYEKKVLIENEENSIKTNRNIKNQENDSKKKQEL